MFGCRSPRSETVCFRPNLKARLFSDPSVGVALVDPLCVGGRGLVQQGSFAAADLALG